MAVQQVRAQINGVWHVLTYNGTTGKYEKTITCPNYNVLQSIGRVLSGNG